MLSRLPHDAAFDVAETETAPAESSRSAKAASCGSLDNINA